MKQVSFEIKEAKIVEYKHDAFVIPKLRIETTHNNVVHIMKSQLDSYLSVDTGMFNPPDWEGIKMEVDFYEPGERDKKGFEITENLRNKVHVEFGFRIVKNHAYEWFSNKLTSLKLQGVKPRKNVTSDPYVESNEPTTTTTAQPVQNAIPATSLTNDVVPF